MMPVELVGKGLNMTAVWNQAGMLVLNMSQLPRIEACHDFAFAFNVTNSHLARSGTPVIKAKTSCLETPEEYMSYSPGEAAPLAQNRGMCSKKIMSQSNPWPGAHNTLTFTFSTNVSLVAKVPAIVRVRSACSLIYVRTNTHPPPPIPISSFLSSPSPSYSALGLSSTI
jgi:hypothetical protein